MKNGAVLVSIKELPKYISMSRADCGVLLLLELADETTLDVENFVKRDQAFSSKGGVLLRS